MILKNSELDRANGKIETLSTYNQTLEKELSDYRNKVQQLNTDMHNEQNDQISKQHKANQQEVQIYDL